MNAVLLVNKTKDKTSRDMVNELNHIFDMKKIGHTGTLDPLATGVLVMCLGKYTKLVDELSSLEKEYIAEIKLGISTDTLDITGNVLETKECKVCREDVIKVFKDLVGKFVQTVPKYSAKKINGKKLYEYAREGKEIKLPKNEVEIYELELLDIKDDIIKFRALVSKGTYIRSLIEEICNKLNVIGTMNSLVRTKQGKFDISNSYTIEQIKSSEYSFLNVKDLLDYPVYNLSEEEYFKVKNGSKIKLNSSDNKVILEYDGNEIAIYEKENDQYRVNIMLI